jgi:hypothetical protein
LLYKKASADTKLLKASFESLGIGAEESFRYNVVLDRNIFAGVRTQPLFAVLFEYL